MWLNLWYVRMEALDANRKSLQYSNEQTDLIITADSILGEDRSESVEKRLKGIFDLSYTTLTTYTNKCLLRWTTMALLANNYDPVLTGG